MVGAEESHIAPDCMHCVDNPEEEGYSKDGNCSSVVMPYLEGPVQEADHSTALDPGEDIEEGHSNFEGS